MQHTKHLWRAGLLVIAFGLSLLFGRHFLIPASFGAEGYYRADSRAELMALPLVHGGTRSCAECHEKEQAEHDSSKHAGVSCEVCHAPLADHASGGKKTAVMPSSLSQRLCNLCHLKLVARPAAFPQIVPQDHLIATGALEPGEAVPDRACGPCHGTHKPDQSN